MKTPNIISTATALPGFIYPTEDIAKAGERWLRNHPEEKLLFSRFLASASTRRRHFALPVDAVLALGGSSSRTKLFERLAPPLAIESITRCFQGAGIDAGQLATFIFTSCSAPVIPSIDAIVAEDCGMRRSVARLPIYQHGCAGGIVGLSLAAKLAAPGEPALLCSTELCSLVFRENDHSAQHLVGSAIFGDGSAAVLAGYADGPLRILAAKSHLVEGTRHLMGYDMYDDGAHLRLDKDLPRRLTQCLPDLLASFLQDNGLQRSDINWWLFHPGGIKILDFLDQAFELRPEQSIFARDVLRDYGNMSSASILFVIDTFIKARSCSRGDLALALGVGPGLTLEFVLLEVN